MNKKRLVFTLLYANEKFFMSRNFDLQEVGDINWILENFQFNSLMRSLDELIILDITKSKPDIVKYVEITNKITKYAFMPVSLGGQIKNIKDVEFLFKNGADKVVINSMYFSNQRELTKIISKFGVQSIICSIDYKTINNSKFVFTNNGQFNTQIDLNNYIKIISKIGYGEILLNSIDNDGLGNGYDFESLKSIYNSTDVPIIASGGADNSEKLYDGLNKNFISAVNTSNLFNFVFDGLKDAREEIISKGVELTKWDFSLLK